MALSPTTKVKLQLPLHRITDGYEAWAAEKNISSNLNDSVFSPTCFGAYILTVQRKCRITNTSAVHCTTAPPHHHSTAPPRRHTTHTTTPPHHHVSLNNLSSSAGWARVCWDARTVDHGGPHPQGGGLAARFGVLPHDVSLQIASF